MLCTYLSTFAKQRVFDGCDDVRRNARYEEAHLLFWLFWTVMTRVILGTICKVMSSFKRRRQWLWPLQLNHAIQQSPFHFIENLSPHLYMNKNKIDSDPDSRRHMAFVHNRLRLAHFVIPCCYIHARDTIFQSWRRPYRIYLVLLVCIWYLDSASPTTIYFIAMHCHMNIR